MSMQKFIPREDKIKKTAEIMTKGLKNFSKELNVSPREIFIVIESVDNQLEPKYRLMKSLKDTGTPLDGTDKPSIRYVTFKEILGRTDFFGFSLLAKGFFRAAFIEYAKALIGAGRQCSPMDIRFMVTSGDDTGDLPFMHLYIGFECIQQITFADIFPEQ